ncbi:hypothetical protein Ancab_000528 [Ancistrocladus abbreviatus]
MSKLGANRLLDGKSRAPPARDTAPMSTEKRRPRNRITASKTEASVSTQTKCHHQRDSAGAAWGSSQTENQNNRAKQKQNTHIQQDHSRGNATPLETPVNRKPEWGDTISAQHHHHPEADREATKTDFIP